MERFENHCSNQHGHGQIWMLYANVYLLLVKPHNMKTRHVINVIDICTNNLFMSIRHIHIEHRNTRFPLLLFLCSVQFTLSLYTRAAR